MGSRSGSEEGPSKKRNCHRKLEQPEGREMCSVLRRIQSCGANKQKKVSDSLTARAGGGGGYVRMWRALASALATLLKSRDERSYRH